MKFKNTALMLNAIIFIGKELDSLCGHNIGSNNISTYKYTTSKPVMDKKSVLDVTHKTGVTLTFWTPYVSFVFITRIRCKRNNKFYIPL